MVYAGDRFRSILYKHRIMKATKKEINMPVDQDCKKAIKKNWWLYFPFTFWMIMFTNFVFFILTGRVG